MRPEEYSPNQFLFFFLGARHVLSSPVLIFARESISADMAKGNQLHRLVMIVNRLAHSGRYMMPEYPCGHCNGISIQSKNSSE